MCSNIELTVDAMEWNMEGLNVNITVAALLGFAAEKTERALQKFATDVTEYVTGFEKTRLPRTIRNTDYN